MTLSSHIERVSVSRMRNFYIGGVFQFHFISVYPIYKGPLFPSRSEMCFSLLWAHQDEINQLISEDNIKVISSTNSFHY